MGWMVLLCGLWKFGEVEGWSALWGRGSFGDVEGWGCGAMGVENFAVVLSGWRTELMDQ